MSSENEKLVIFDFDGVLANTEEFCFKIHKDFNGSLTWEKFQSFAEGNFHDGIEKVVKEESYIIPPNFYKFYEKNLSVISIHDVIRNTIFCLKDKYRLAIVSSTNSSYISNFLKKEKVSDCFNEILGHDVHFSKVVKINILLNKYKIKPENVIFITDSLGDLIESNKCKVHSVGVTWGLHGREILGKENVDAVIDDPRDLLETIQNVLK